MKKQLIEFIKKGKLDSVEEMLVKESDLVNCYVNKYTPLIEAIRARIKNIDIVKLLVESGADVEKIDLNAPTPTEVRHTNCEGDSWYKHLSRKLKFYEIFWKHNESPLFHAISHYDHKILEYLTQKTNIKVNKKSGTAENAPLHWSIITKKEGAMDLLLKHKDIEVNITDKDSRTPLHRAVEEDAYRFVWLLLLHEKTNLKAEDRNGRTPEDTNSGKSMKTKRLISEWKKAETIRSISGDVVFVKQINKIVEVMSEEENVLLPEARGVTKKELYIGVIGNIENLTIADTVNNTVYGNPVSSEKENKKVELKNEIVIADTVNNQTSSLPTSNSLQPTSNLTQPPTSYSSQPTSNLTQPTSNSSQPTSNSSHPTSYPSQPPSNRPTQNEESAIDLAQQLMLDIQLGR